MSWLKMLYATYENLSQVEGIELLPIAHTTQKAQIEVTINQQSNFVMAKVVNKDESETLIPCTEESAGRSGSAPIHHPLMDKLQYLAGDYGAFGGKKGKIFHEKYMEDLRKWCTSKYSNKKVQILQEYLEKGGLIGDLVNAGIVKCDATNRLIEKWSDKATTPDIYKVIPGDLSDAFVRFRVISEDNVTALWEDKSLQENYINYYLSTRSVNGMCNIMGEEVSCAVNHPNKIRNTGDKAKLISANDGSGFTYRGRFWDFNEAALVGYEVSQKAHNALKYLIKKQGNTYGTKVFVAWSPEGFTVQGLNEDSLDAIAGNLGKTEYTAEEFARKFHEVVSGWKTHELNYQSEIAIMGVDAATTGRMAITFYREMLQNELIDRILGWHESCAWKHRYRFNADKQMVEFIGAPSPKDIALAAFGVERNFLEIDNKLCAVVVERIFHCIVDGTPLPRDVVNGAFRNVCHPQNYKNINNWRKVLSICCSLVKKYRYDISSEKEREVWTMEIERECKDLNYLCGRMLAVADAMERNALDMKSEKRETAAMRYFTKFQEHPSAAWGVILKSLRPYINKLEPGVRIYYEKKLADISSTVDPEQFAKAVNLDGRMALGFYAQQNENYGKRDKTNSEDNVK